MHSDPLGMVMMRCPETGQPFSTGVAMTRGAFTSPNCLGGEAPCPSCGGAHRWSQPDAWLQVDADRGRAADARPLR